MTSKNSTPADHAPVYQLTSDDTLTPAIQQGKIVLGLMSSRLPATAAQFATYQSYFETAAFAADLWKLHNNGSGIKFAGQKGAVKGANGFAWFPGADGRSNWADAFKHELTKGSNPAGAKTLEDYVSRLQANHYFGNDNPNTYLSGLKRARLVLAAMPADQHADGTTDYNTNTGIETPKPVSFIQSLEDKWNAATPLEKGVVIGVPTLLIFVSVLKK